MKTVLKNEFFLINIFSVILILAIYINGFAIVRLSVGLPFILFFPGYTLTTVIFPGRFDLSAIERLALSIGLSIIVVPFIGLVLNYLPCGISLFPILLSITVFILIMSALGWFRRCRLSEEKSFKLECSVSCKWAEMSKSKKMVALILVGSMIFTLGTLIYVSNHPRPGENFTEFFILGPDGVAADYPSKLKVNEYGKVIAVVVNNEHQIISYRMEVRMDDDLILSEIPLSLGHGEKWEKNISFKVSNPVINTKLELLLFREGDPLPYRKIHLWMDVVKNERSAATRK